MKTLSLKCDVVIFGGGVAGLWLLAVLRQKGYQTLLLETTALGAGQTRFAQGIIHGGTKYALLGKVTASSEAITAMPNVWRDCLQGKGIIDLSKVKVLSENQCMWSHNTLSSKVAGFFASKLMRSRTTEIKKQQRPKIFQHAMFKGKVYKLDEPVLDTASIVHALAEPHRDAIMHINGLPQFDQDNATQFEVEDSTGKHWHIEAQRCVLMAGQGNADLATAIGSDELPAMQLRALKMVMLRGNLPEKIYAHCLEANVNPRLTITSYEDSKGETVWYLGGQLAEEGIGRNDDEQINVAQQELNNLMPWIDLGKIQWACLDINRAEPKMVKGKRPDTSFFSASGVAITAWPTKLALAPKLAADILEQMIETGLTASAQSLPELAILPEFPTPDYAPLPWQEESRWLT
ncbi:Oxidoreductase, FAD-binding [hydrothermal vent metagenome]|uniref:Oxidoreductase, FAD-binding n=1 Tax=hydrothermal vent metagenome TaxID=652676 RepID=A0A3B1AIB2_9ZZZZ